MFFNKVILMGNLTREPEIRYTPSGTSVCNFSIAVNRKYKQNDEYKDEVMFIGIVTFGKLAENCQQYLSKGSPVLVDGRLRENRWETDDGKKRSKHEITANSVLFLGKKKESGSNQEEEQIGDDVPF